MRVPSRNEILGIGLPLLLSVFLTACSQNPQANDKTSDKPGLLGGIFESTKPITVPEGTVLDVVLDQSLSTAENRSGDIFQASLASPIVIDGKTVIPKDAHVKGHVLDAQTSGRLKGVARLDLTLDSIDVNGKTYDIQTDDMGRTGQNHKKRNVEMIGGGAGVGALIGGLAGGGKGALIGGAVGAGAGTGAAAYTGKKDIHVPAETALSFRLTRPVTIQVKG